MTCSLCNEKRNSARDFDLVAFTKTELISDKQKDDKQTECKSPEKVYHACGVCYLLAKELLEKDTPQVDDVEVEAIYQYVEGRASIYLDHTFKPCKGGEVPEKTKELGKRLLSKFYNSSKDNNSNPRLLTKAEMIEVRDAFLKETKTQSILDYVPNSNGKQALLGLGIFAALSYCSYKVYEALSSRTDDESNGRVPTREVYLPTNGFLEKV